MKRRRSRLWRGGFLAGAVLLCLLAPFMKSRAALDAGAGDGRGYEQDGAAGDGTGYEQEATEGDGTGYERDADAGSNVGAGERDLAGGDVTQEEVMEDLLSDLDFAEIDQFLDNLQGTEKISFGQVVDALLEGDFQAAGELFGGFVSDSLFYEWRVNKSTIIHILIISLIAATLTGFSDIFKNRQISDVSYYMIYMLLLTILMTAFRTASAILTDTLTSVVDFMKALMPALFLALGYSAGTTTTLVFYEWILFLLTAVQWAVRYLIVPGIHIYLLLLLVNQMAKEDFLTKLAGLFKTVLEWGLKVMMGAVVGFNLIQGLITPAVDSLKKDFLSKTAGMIPGIGNVLNSVSEMVLGCAVLIKNGIGAAALIILAVICLLPVIKLALFSLSYKLAAAVVQPVADTRIVECISSVGDGMVLLLKAMLTSAILFWLTLAILCGMTGR